MRISIIGLGRMGEGIAGRVLGAGHAVTVYNRTAAKADTLRGKGATVASSPAKAARDAEVVLTMLADDAAVEQVVFEPDGILGAMGAGAVHVSSSTISVALAQRMAAAHRDRGSRYVSAPVMGRPDVAAAGKLFVIAAGAEDAVQTVQPVFDVIGQRTYHMGTEPSVANLIKLSNNFLLASIIEASAEAFALVRKGGVDPLAYREMLTTSFLNVPIYHTYSDLVAREGDETVGFAAPLGLKDVRLALAAGDTLRVPMPFASTVRDAFITALARGYEHRDWSVLGRIAAENAGLNGK
ncbi:MAG TPA: NAD(P)-dependent oxidoreductase [Gemmatimonadaceae bacterium]|jgi:3-hydroxyisobutyrate dehydrogenase-like beta-hydroxyacid dehydrogenase|nr:NAD(P)-dependent oxidoreductase [Gemmatimonadaceae bacterium]